MIPNFNFIEGTQVTRTNSGRK